MISPTARDLLPGVTTDLQKAKNMTQVSRILAGISLAAALAPAMAAPTIYDQRAPNAAGGQIGSGAPGVAEVAAARSAFVGGLAAGYREDNLASAPYDVEDPFGSGFAAKVVELPFGVLSGGTLTPGSGVGAGLAYVDTLLTQPFSTGGRYDPTTPACAASTEEAEIEKCTARWFESSGEFTILFGDSFSAFGFYGTDFGDFRGQLFMELLGTGGNAVASHRFTGFTSGLNGALGFFGFSDSNQAYTGVRLTVEQVPGDQSPDFFGFDNLVLGNASRSNPVPEPGSLALVGASLLALSATRRRRKA